MLAVFEVVILCGSSDPGWMTKSEAHRSKSITRHFTLVADLLRGREHDRHSLAERLHIRPAQADRLMNAALEHLPGVSEFHEGKQRKIRIDPTAFAAAPSYPTAVAACFGSSLWHLFEGTTYGAGIRDAAKDVIGRTKRRAVFRDIDRKFWFLRRGGEVALVDRAELLDEVLEAVLHHRVLALDYTNFGGTSACMRIEPLSLALHDHQLYIVGRDPKHALHPYRFARIRTVNVLDDTFTYPDRAAYDPEQVFRDSFGIFLDKSVQDVVLKLHKQWATYATSHRWHDSQNVEVHDDHVLVRMRVSVCPELVAWILGFGEEAEVVSPSTLRDEITLRALALHEVYARPPALGVKKARRREGAAAPTKVAARRARQR